MRRRAVGRVVAVLGIVAACTTACGAHAAPGDGGEATRPAPAASPTRYWSAGAGYCDLLTQSLQAGATPFAGMKADDPALAATARDWVAAVRSAAPSAVQEAWRTEGDALLAAVGGSGTAPDPTGVRQAAATIAADARTRCGVDVLGGPSGS